MAKPGTNPWRAFPRLLGLGAAMAFALIEYTFRRMHRSSPATRAQWLSRWSRWALPWVGIHLTIEGEKPQNGLLIANHQSYTDILALSAAVPVVFVSKQEVQDWPAFGIFAKLSGTLFLDRSRRADVGRLVKEMETLRADGVLLALFPEGTTSDGLGVLPFKTPLLEPFCAASAPVWSSYISYHVPEDGHGRSVAWYGDDLLAPHLLKLLGKSRVEVRIRFSPKPLIHPDRKELAIRLREEVLRLSSE